MSMSEKHSDQELEAMLILIKESLIELYGHLKLPKETSHEASANKLVKVYREEINKLLDQPHGGTLSPEEIAEIILAQELYYNGDLHEEAAATSLMYT